MSGDDLASVDPLTFTFSGLSRPPQVSAVLADEAWRAVFIDELREARAAHDVASLQARLDQWAAQIAPDLATDPNRGFTDEQNAAALAEVRSVLAARADYIDTWLAAR